MQISFGEVVVVVVDCFYTVLFLIAFIQCSSSFLSKLTALLLYAILNELKWCDQASPESR